MIQQRLNLIRQDIQKEKIDSRRKIRTALTAVFIEPTSFVHNGIFKLLIAVILDYACLQGIIYVYQHGFSIFTYLSALETAQIVIFVVLILFIFSVIFYKKAGLIQIVLLMMGLGLGYGYGSRFHEMRTPRFSSDYDLGLFAIHPVRLYHKRDPRIVASRILLMLLTWKKVDLKHYPMIIFEEKEGVLLLSLTVEHFLSPITMVASIPKIIQKSMS